MSTGYCLNLIKFHFLLHMSCLSKDGIRSRRKQSYFQYKSMLNQSVNTLTWIENSKILLFLARSCWNCLIAWIVFMLQTYKQTLLLLLLPSTFKEMDDKIDINTDDINYLIMLNISWIEKSLVCDDENLSQYWVILGKKLGE